MIARLASVAILAAASAAFTAPAQAVPLRVDIAVGPPAPRGEVIPVPRPGWVWAPGYWAWHGDRYIWMRGRTMMQRVGYRWEPDRWEQRGNGYYRQPGMWQRDAGYRVFKAKKAKKEKKPKH